MLYLPITKTWIISRSARAIYLACAVLACMLFGALIAIWLAMGFSGVNSLSAFPLALSIARAVLLPGVLGTATLSIAMWYFWFNFDNASWGRKAFWALPLYFLLPIGPALYYFFVYLRNPDIASLSVRSPEGGVERTRDPVLTGRLSDGS
jgi:hypothetical protein